MMLGSVIGTVIAIMTVSDTIGKDIREANIKNAVNELRSNYEVKTKIFQTLWNIRY